MNDWTEWEHKEPPFDTLVLVVFDTGEHGLRSLTYDGDLYDEHEFYDDSEMVPLAWKPL